MALRCLYTDLDGTLLGKGGSLFRDIDGNFSRTPSLLIEACHRAEVEVVLMSGRRESGVGPQARLLGQTSYIYEAGCALMIDGELTVISGNLDPDGERTIAERIGDAGIPALLFEVSDGGLEWAFPWHTERKYSLLLRGHANVDVVNAALAEAGHDGYRFLDNGAIDFKMPDGTGAHAYHVVPAGVSKGTAVAAHMRARGFTAEECIAAGDSIEDLTAAEPVSRFFCVANGPERDPGLKAALVGHDNVTVTEGQAGAGVYEAVISTLAQG